MNSYIIRYLLKLLPIGFTVSTISIGTVFWSYNNIVNKNIEVNDIIINNDI